MKKINELITEKEEAKREKDRDRIIYMTIVSEYQKEHPDDDSIFEVFKQEQDLRRVATSNWAWERVEDGFVSRTNFAFDEKEQEITYDSYYIAKLGDKYVPDGTKVADEYYVKHVGDFTALAKVEDIIRKYRIKYEDKVNEQLKKYETRKKLMSRSFIEIVNMNDRHTNMYFEYYGSIGKKLLIKWLNRLNRLDIDLDTLLIEFKTDVSTAKLYLDTEDNKNYQRAKLSHMELEFVLLRVLERYSPRGTYFRSNYYQHLDKQRTV